MTATIFRIHPAKASFDSPSWQMAAFSLETEPSAPERVWLVGTFPSGVVSKLALVQNADTAKLLIEALAFAQEIYKRKNFKEANTNG